IRDKLVTGVQTCALPISIEFLLYDTYRMAKNSIARGNQDSWTITPKRIEALEAEAEAAKAKPTERPAGPSPVGPFFDNARTAPEIGRASCRERVAIAGEA